MALTNRGPRPTKIDRQLEGEPIQAGERTVQPVAHLAGWTFAAQGETGSGAGAWLRLTPVEVLVRDRDGSDSRIPITDTTGAALQGIAQAAVAIGVLGFVLTWILGRLGRRQARKE